jgi:predicted double-glycine peptidase
LSGYSNRLEEEGLIPSSPKREIKRVKNKILILYVIINLLPVSVWAGVINFYGGGGVDIRRRVVSLKVARFKNIVPQSVDFSCGAAALATLLRYYYGEDVNEKEIVRYILEHGDAEQLKQTGFSFLDLKHYASNLDYRAAGYKLVDYKLLDKLKVPVIVLISTEGYQHFVVLKGLANDRVYIADPLRGNIALYRSDFYDVWKNRVLFVVLGDDPKRGNSHLELEAAVAEAPLADVVRLNELGIANLNNLQTNNLSLFSVEF